MIASGGETLFLDNNCENCQSREYMEHDSGFYVCVNCAVVSQMRHGLALEYKDLNSKGIKFKRKNIEEINDEEQMDFNNFETNMNTMNNTCANSEFNDSISVTSRITKLDTANSKPVSEVLFEHQNTFVKLFKSIFYYQFTLAREAEYYKINFNNSYNNQTVNINGNHCSRFDENVYDANCDNFKNKRHSLKYFYDNLFDYDKNINIHISNNDHNQLLNYKKDNFISSNKDVFDNEENKNVIRQNYEKLFFEAKEKWLSLMKSELEIQLKKKPLSFRKRDIRSRRNTEDELSQMNNLGVNSYNKNASANLLSFSRLRDKRVSITDELRQRRIKSKNINQVDAYKNTRLKNKEKMKKFVEEHDQVLANLREAKDYIKLNTGINIDETLTFKNLMILADLFGIRIPESATYEDYIHAFFIKKELNYISLYSEKLFDENKSNLTSDSFLNIFYECFNSNKNAFNQNNPFMIYEITNLYKKFLMNNLHAQEIKFLKYLSKEKVYKGFLQSKISCNKSSITNIIKYISHRILKIPDFFSDFAIRIFNICEIAIEKHINHIYNFEVFAISTVILTLRYFYGLNDLQYFYDFKHSIKNGSLPKKIIEDLKLEKIYNLYDEISKSNKTYLLYNNLPSSLEVINNLIKQIICDERKSSLWDSLDFKRILTSDYKEKFISYNNTCLFHMFENISCLKNMNELENKITYCTQKIKRNNNNIDNNSKITPNNVGKINNLSVLNSKIIHFNQNDTSNNPLSSLNGKTNNLKKINNNYKINASVKLSVNFRNKVSKKFSLNSYTNKEFNTSPIGSNEIKDKIYIQNSNYNNPKITKFLKEELDFYKRLLKKNKINKNIIIPLPCDTIIKFNKKAFKFSGVTPPTSELIIFYLFSKLFQTEVQVLRKATKILELYLDNKFKKF